MKNWVAIKKQGLIAKYRLIIREKAIAQAKVEISLAGKKNEDYDQEQLEIIVKAEEDKIIRRYKNSSLVLLLLALGLY